MAKNPVSIPPIKREPRLKPVASFHCSQRVFYHSRYDDNDADSDDVLRYEISRLDLDTAVVVWSTVVLAPYPTVQPTLDANITSEQRPRCSDYREAGRPIKLREA